MKILASIKKIGSFVKNNKLLTLRLVQMGLTALSVTFPHAIVFANIQNLQIIGGAGKDGAGIEPIYDDIVNYLPGVVCGISVATGGIMYTIGQQDLTKVATRVGVGGGIAMTASAVPGYLSGSGSAGDVSGMLF